MIVKKLQNTYLMIDLEINRLKVTQMLVEQALAIIRPEQEDSADEPTDEPAVSDSGKGEHNVSTAPLPYWNNKRPPEPDVLKPCPEMFDDDPDPKPEPDEADEPEYVTDPWSDEECALARDMIGLGSTARDIASALDRPLHATRAKITAIKKQDASAAEDADCSTDATAEFKHTTPEPEPDEPEAAPDGWTDELDLVLVAGLTRGKGLKAVAKSLDKSLDDCRQRFRDLFDGRPTHTKQQKMITSLRMRIAEAKNLKDAG